MNEIYNRSALRTIDGIPVFMTMDAYVDNYTQIANDHLASVDADEGNPFMHDTLIDALDEQLHALLASYCAPGKSIVDLGCGMGNSLAPLKDMKRFGVDISIPYLKRARDRGIDVCASLLEELPYRDEQFDIAICCDVLEHVVGFERAIQEIRRVLKPGGVALMRVPFEEDLSWYASPSCTYEYVHLRRFDLPTLALATTKIARMKLISSNLGGTVPGFDNCRLQLGFDYAQAAVVKSARMISKAFPTLGKRMNSALFRPLFVTVVAERTA